MVAPEWLRTVSPPEWRDRYTRRADEDRLPTTQTARAALTLTMGNDGRRLLSAVDHPDAPPWLREVSAVVILRRVWLQHYGWDATQLQWREADNIPPAARFISSPSEADAPYARQHTTPWVGYKVHLTEACEDDLPHLITPIATAPGPTADGATPPTIHAALQQRGLLPGTPLVDTGFLDADLFVQSRDDYGVDLLGPTRLDDHWQAQAGAGVDAQHFQIAWNRQHAICPAGKTSISWTPAIDHRKHAVMKVKFSSKDGRRGAHGTHCLRAQQRSARRTLTIRPERQYQALQAARQRAATDTFRAASARRADLAGTISRETRRMRLRRTRDIGLRRVHWGHIFAAVGLNVWRLGEWFLETTRANTRITPFAQLMAHAPAA